MKTKPDSLRRLLSAARSAPPPPAADIATPPPGFVHRILILRGRPPLSASHSDSLPFLVMVRNLSLGAAAVVVCAAIGIGLLLPVPDGSATEDDAVLQSQLESWVAPL